MLDLWQEARIFCRGAWPSHIPGKQVHPSQLYGLETNVYAQELASVVVWIGYLQWLNEQRHWLAHRADSCASSITSNTGTRFSPMMRKASR